VFQVAVHDDQTRGREAYGCVPASALHPNCSLQLFSTLCFDQPHDNDEVAHKADGFHPSNNGSTADAAVIRPYSSRFHCFSTPAIVETSSEKRPGF
jgi:hypothetical protein